MMLVEVSQLTDTKVALSVTTGSSTHGGVVYCGIFSSPSQFTSNYDIRDQEKLAAIGTGLTTSSIAFEGLSPLNTYYAYCYAEDVLGNGGSYKVSLDRGIQFDTSCCNAVKFSSSSPTTLFADVNQYSTMSSSSKLSYEIKFSLSAKPQADVTANVVFYDDSAKSSIQSNVFASPSAFTFNSNSKSLSGSFLAYGIVGSFYVSLELQGDSADEYGEVPARFLALVATASTAPLPVLTAATFDSTGQRLTVTFQTPTDSAVGVTGGKSVWKCDLVLSFLGASTSGCSWTNSTQIIAVLNYYSVADENLVAGDAVNLLPGVLNGFCYAAACTDSFAPSSTVNATVVSNFIQPTVIIKVPSRIGNCESLHVDPTQSTGNAGRDWSHVEWIVTAADGSDTSAVEAVLENYPNTSSVITIDASLLSRTTYTISLGLKNFLQAPTAVVVFAAVQTEVVAEESSLFVQISGSKYESRVTSKTLSRTASSLLTVCLDGSVTTVTPDVSVDWSVYEVSATNNLHETAIVSESTNPNVFKASAYKFNVDSTYEITATSTAVWDSSEITESASFQVFIKRGAVTASINGYKNASVQHPRNSLLFLDGGESKDSDDIGATLSYQWGCKNLGLESFGQDCFNDREESELTESSMTFPALSLAEDSRLEISLTVASTTNGLLKTGTAKVFVEVVSDLTLNMNVVILQSSDVYSPQTNLIIDSVVDSDASGGVTATWSLQSASDVDLSSDQVLLSPSTRSFSMEEVTSGLNFPLGIRSNILTGGVEYIFRLRVEDSAGNALFREVSVVPNAPPVGGSFKVRPRTGHAFITNFKFSAPNWGDDPEDYPIGYIFAYQDASSFNPSLTYDQVGVRGTAFSASTLLPEGLSTDDSTISCVAFISDYWGAASTLETSVTVTEGDLLSEYSAVVSNMRHQDNGGNTRSLYSAEVDSFIISDILPFYINEFKEANRALQIETMQSSLLVSANLLTSLGSVNCSSAPDCASLNRHDCSATSHTCGECLSGFEGVYGDSNYLCQDPSTDHLPDGSICISSDECEYGNCEANICQIPVKICPLGSSNGLECSGRGQCKYRSYYGEVTANDCREDDTSCYASCSCDAGLGGSDCSVDESQMTELDAARGLLCENLQNHMLILDSTEDKLSFGTNILRKVFAYDEVVESVSMNHCVNALSTVDATLFDLTNTTVSDLIHSSVVSVVSDFVRSSRYADASSQVESVVDNLGSNILNTMVQGPASIDYVSDNLRVSYKHELISLLSGTSMSAPQTAEEIHYGVSVASVDIPATGLTSCENFDNYARLAVVSWGFNPYTRDSSLSTSLFGVLPLATKEVSSVLPTPSLSSYQFTLPIILEPNWTKQEPICSQYLIASGGLIADCDFCNITSYNDKNVTFTCVDSASVFCPTETSLSSDVYYAVSAADRADPDVTLSFELETKQSAGALGFFAAILVVLIIGLLIVRHWDEVDRSAIIFEINEKKREGPYRFDLTAAFDERGMGAPRIFDALGDSVESGSSRSNEVEDGAAFDNVDVTDDTLQITDGTVDYNRETAIAIRDQVALNDQVDTDIVQEDVLLKFEDESSIGSNYSLAAYEFPLTSLLSYGLFWERLWAAIKRHHKWVRVFTYPSIRKSRVIRLLVAGTDLLFLLFAVTLFFGVFYPDDNECEKLLTEVECLELTSRYFHDSQCTWNSDNECRLDPPPLNMKFLAFACSLIIIVTVLPRRLLQMLLEDVCNRRPILEDIGKSSGKSLRSEPVTLGDPVDIFNEPDPQDLTRRYADEAWVEPQRSTDFSTLSNHVTPYRLGYCDSISIQEEINVIIVSAKELFNATLETAPLPWHMDTSEEHAQDPEVKQLAAMGSIMRWMSLHPDGTPIPLTPIQKLRYGTPVKRMTSKLDRVRKSAGWIVDKATGKSNIRPGEVDFQENILIQHFIMEQVSPICRFGILKDFYHHDNASCGRISFMYWLAAWVAIFVAWIIMGGWCIVWASSNGTAGVKSWAVCFAVLFLVDNVLNEMCQIYFLNVIVTDKLRPQLQQIYDVLAHILETRWSSDFSQGSDIRVIQHLSPACRAARVPSLNNLAASKLLGLIDDKDVVLCRNKRLTTWKEVGFFSYLTLFIPSFIHDGNEIVQKTILDLIFPVFWLFFFLVNCFMYSVSIGLLIAFYVVAIILIFYFTHLVKQDWFKEYIGKVSDSMDDNLEIDVNKIGGGISRKESNWDKMNNISTENYELTGFNIDMVEYDEGLVKQQYTFPNFPDKKKQGAAATSPTTSAPLPAAGQKKSRRPTMMIREMEAAREAKKQASSRTQKPPVDTPPVLKEEDSEEDNSDSQEEDEVVVLKEDESDEDSSDSQEEDDHARALSEAINERADKRKSMGYED